MSQIIDMRRKRRGEQDRCTRALIMDMPLDPDNSGIMHICERHQDHEGFHTCYCGIVFRENGNIFVPQALPGFPNAPAWFPVT